MCMNVLFHWAPWTPNQDTDIPYWLLRANRRSRCCKSSRKKQNPAKGPWVLGLVVELAASRRWGPGGVARWRPQWFFRAVSHKWPASASRSHDVFPKDGDVIPARPGCQPEKPILLPTVHAQLQACLSNSRIWRKIFLSAEPCAEQTHTSGVMAECGNCERLRGGLWLAVGGAGTFESRRWRRSWDCCFFLVSNLNVWAKIQNDHAKPWNILLKNGLDVLCYVFVCFHTVDCYGHDVLWMHCDALFMRHSNSTTKVQLCGWSQRLFMHLICRTGTAANSKFFKTWWFCPRPYTNSRDHDDDDDDDFFFACMIGALLFSEYICMYSRYLSFFSQIDFDINIQSC